MSSYTLPTAYDKEYIVIYTLFYFGRAARHDPDRLKLTCLHRTAQSEQKISAGLKRTLKPRQKRFGAAALHSQNKKPGPRCISRRDKKADVAVSRSLKQVACTGPCSSS